MAQGGVFCAITLVQPGAGNATMAATRTSSYKQLSRRQLSKMPDETLIYPGHGLHRAQYSASPWNREAGQRAGDSAKALLRGMERQDKTEGDGHDAEGLEKGDQHLLPLTSRRNPPRLPRGVPGSAGQSRSETRVHDARSLGKVG